ncbi:hypothetical protein M0805_007698 [Coniferiporia weirii]|nr:hypothetical protein M0805_007698 [Coniferiporia weirii]
MRIATLLAYGLLPAVLSVAARGGPGGGNDGDDDNDNDNDDGADNAVAGPSSTASAAASLSSAASGGNTTGLTGDSQCSELMCVSAVVNGSTVEYVLQSTGAASLGWMAMGFGSQMPDTPMVIMWTNSDGSITLSQRQAPQEVMPTVVANPPRIATAAPSLTSVTGSTPKFGYTIPANSDTSQAVIWAFGTTNPEDSAVDATLLQHLDSNTFTLDLTKPLSANSTLGNPASGSSGSLSVPYQPYQKLLIAHAVLLSLAFLVVLPAGALIARWLRTRTPRWFRAHWLLQFYIAGPMVVAGIGLGIAAVAQQGVAHLDDDHKRWGVAIFALYVGQCAFGGVVHFVKPASAKPDPATGAQAPRTRPPQNYGHAIVGLLVISLAFYQVHTGYDTEWPSTTGRGPVPHGVDVAWTVWVVLVPVLYVAGLALLPKQYKQERGGGAGQGVALSPLPRRTGSYMSPSAYAARVDSESTAHLSPVTSDRGHGERYLDSPMRERGVPGVTVTPSSYRDGGLAV